MSGLLQVANNAQSTLAGSISNVAVSCTLASGSGALFPTLTGSQYFMMTFQDASTGELNEIVKVTARSGDVLTIVRAQEGTTGLAWTAGDLASNFWTKGSFQQLLQIGDSSIRTKLASNTDFYVATTGDNANDGLTVGTPWATLQYAWNHIRDTYDLGGFIATVNIADGTYTVGLNADGELVGLGTLIFDGNTTTPANVLISVTDGNCFSGINGCRFTVRGVKMVATGTGDNGCGINVNFLASIYFDTVNFGACEQYHVNATGNGVIYATDDYTISGAAAVHWGAGVGQVLAADITITISGTPAFSGAFAAATGSGAYIYCPGNTFTGSATGLRYNASLNGVINTLAGGATYLPGGTGGATSTGGQYA